MNDPTLSFMKKSLLSVMWMLKLKPPSCSYTPPQLTCTASIILSPCTVAVMYVTTATTWTGPVFWVFSTQLLSSLLVNQLQKIYKISHVVVMQFTYTLQPHEMASQGSRRTSHRLPSLFVRETGKDLCPLNLICKLQLQT